MQPEIIGLDLSQPTDGCHRSKRFVIFCRMFYHLALLLVKIAQVSNGPIGLLFMIACTRAVLLIAVRQTYIEKQEAQHTLGSSDKGKRYCRELTDGGARGSMSAYDWNLQRIYGWYKCEIVNLLTREQRDRVRNANRGWGIANMHAPSL